MYTKRILTVLATGALSLGLVAGASASGAAPGDLTPDATFGPAQHGEAHDNGDQPDNPGQPDDTGRPDDSPSQANTAGAENSNAPLTPGRPDDAGPGLRSMPELPSNVSARATAAVGAAFELQGMIAEKIAALRGLSSEEIADGAVDDVLQDFAGMFRYVSDAVAEVETPGGGEPDGNGADAGLNADANEDEGDGDEGDEDEGDEDEGDEDEGEGDEGEGDEA